MNRNKHLEDYYLGTLVGGAIGDALGYAVEFLSLDEIKAKYGFYGIAQYDLDGNNKAHFSDDTQLTLFTINGLLNGETKKKYDNDDTPLYQYVYYAYLDWLATQGIAKKCQDPYRKDSWLINIKELNVTRSPGRTCLSSLALGDEKHLYNLNNPINNSKGCGAVMRIAPIGLLYPRYKDIFLLSAEVASLTHGHPMSHLASQLMAMIIANIFKYEEKTLWRVIKDTTKELSDRYKIDAPQGLEKFYSYVKPYLPEFIAIIRRSLVLVKFALVEESKGKIVKDLDNIASLGEGWVAEESIAIAIYCAVRYQKVPMQGIIASVNHNGDSDSTGALTGQLLGAYYGMSIFPTDYINKLELEDVIEEMAMDLLNGCQFDSHSKDSKEKSIWEDKYLYHNYRK